MKEVKFTIPSSVRSKKNSKRIFACGRFKKVLPSKAYEAWQDYARRSVFFYLSGVKSMCFTEFDYPLSCPVRVEAHFYYKGPKPDLSGALESIGDCLQGIMWADDGQIESWDGSRLHHDLDNPRTEVTVRWE
ncbi:MAG: RusA family crossover junction endodeoxyribonuclease [Syntrophorhabdaceae bacterium]|nr:RusA family crossover junction endodeoxyribonuclease [Syntrophorhabdaceae bacterium]